MANPRADHNKLISAFMPEWLEHPNVPSVQPKTLAAFEALLARGIDINVTDNSGVTILHLAAGYGKAELAKWLVEHGANPWMVDRTKQTPRENAEEHLEYFREGDDPIKPMWPMRIPGLEQTIAVLKEAERKSPGKRGAPFEPPQPAILKIPVAKRRGLCSHGLETAQQLMIRAPLERIAKWFERQRDIERVERDVMPRLKKLSPPLGQTISLVKLKGQRWVYVGFALKQDEPMSTYFAELDADGVLQAGAEDTSGRAYAVLYRDGAIARKAQSRGSNWSNVDKFLKENDAYLTFAWAGFRGKSKTLELIGYYPDETLPPNVERVDLVYFKPSGSRG